MNQFIYGQRFMSMAEPELGLGLVESVEDKIIQVSFPAAEEIRRYGIKSAPLKRIIFEVGDEVVLNDQRRFLVTETEIDATGLIKYLGEEHSALEVDLLDSISFHHPEQKLINGLSDRSGLFQLRQQTFQHKTWLSHHPYRGFLGARVSLIEHQLYLVDKITNRMFPRVLLADEVGLGKTIESGLILNQLLITNRVSRVLIVTPNTLNYQWFVEMLRKYNLTFSVVNEQTELEVDTNPFDQNNLVITSMQLLCGSETAKEMVAKSNWDLMIVDEAHKLFWKAGNPSTQYQVVEELTVGIPGLILLTATPEIYGLEGHFSHLRLIDPDRFNDYDEYLKEQNSFREQADKAKELLAGDLSSDSPEILEMIDRHGPGRVYFRNTRELIDKHHQYFPERNLKAYSLENKKQISWEKRDHKSVYQTKLHWLINYLEENPQKTLLICHAKETVLKIEKDLKKLTVGNKVGVFHEDLSFMARDRQAAFFRDEDGANLLLCSEIGSEGRNFQFCQDLILFDLPPNPDLLEQRIGRLDRIGQKNIIHLHVPYLENTWEEILFDWYHDVFNSFNESVKGAGHITEQFKDSLGKMMNFDLDRADIFNKAKLEFEQLTQKQEEGRNVLLEINSFNRTKAEEIIKEIKAIDYDDRLKNFLEQVYSEFGVDVEDLNDHSQFIKPGDNMFIPHFPYLTEEGMTYTFDRQVALEREEIHFMSWDHPMVVGILDLITGEEFGNATVMMRKNGQVKNFVEFYFSMQSSSPKSLQINTFLPSTPIRVLIDVKGNDFSEKWSKELLDDKLTDADQAIISKTMTIPKAKLKELINQAHELAVQKGKTILNESCDKAEKSYNLEINRLQELQKINSAISDDEINLLIDRKDQVVAAIKSSNIGLDSLRFIY